MQRWSFLAVCVDTTVEALDNAPRSTPQDRRPEEESPSAPPRPLNVEYITEARHVHCARLVAPSGLPQGKTDSSASCRVLSSCGNACFAAGFAKSPAWKSRPPGCSAAARTGPRGWLANMIWDGIQRRAEPSCRLVGFRKQCLDGSGSPIGQE